MTRASRQQAGAAAGASTFDIQRIRVRRDGHDASGAYWGAGLDVFIATSPDGAEEITVRARNVADARAKVAAELDRKLGEARAGEREPIGGASPHKSRYEITWRNPVTNEDVRIRITHARDYLATGNDHIEVESIAPKKAPLPITETGYRSHFLSPLELMNAGGPVTFVTTWIEHEAKGKTWSKAATAKQQGDLFSWAEAQGEIGTSKQTTKPTARRPDGMPSRRRKARRDPEAS